LRDFFLSDYGTRDEFVGVVHAVLTAWAPGVTVIDLSHEIPAFDVRAGARLLERAAPWLGAGVVLAVVDPGVGSARRGVCLEAALGPSPDDGPRFYVGPDNGLLMGAGTVARAVELPPSPPAAPSRTFDGRDLFAPAAAALCRGVPLEQLGSPVDPATLERLPPPIVSHQRSPDGRQTLRAEIIWVDRFGNLALAAAAEHDPSAPILLAVPDGTTHPVRRVASFAELAPAELGLLLDANGHLALVANQGSAARRLALEAGAVIQLTW
jgi:S-adenosyl-L-methionine hydrolase (adenosine-forming)